jgi:hypothetical protein
VKSRFLLDVVVAEGTTILELFAGKNESLLVGRDTDRNLMKITTAPG